MARNLARAAGRRLAGRLRLPGGDGHRGAHDGGQVAAGLLVDAALQVGAGAAAQQRREPVGDPLLVAGVGQRGADVVEQGGRGRRRPGRAGRCGGARGRR